MGKACTFFGHHDCPSSIKPKLREILIDLVENHTVDMFYVGQQGAFDGIVRSVLKRYIPTSITPLYWSVYPQSVTSSTPAIIPIPCSRRVSRQFIPVSLFLGETSG